MARRQNHTLVLVLAVFGFLFFLTYIFSVPSSKPALQASPASAAKFEEQKAAFAGKGEAKGDGKSEFALNLDEVAGSGILAGESIAPKLENATLKAELGRATWKFLHTMVARFPDEPSQTDRTTLETFFSLFGRLYPCGDCAKHFREMLVKYPPQTSSRSNAAGWLCFVHNVVNERLQKEIFDCNNIGDFYDCGCGEEGKEKKEGVVQDEIKREDEKEEKKQLSGDGEGTNTEEVTEEDRIKEQVEEVDEGKEKKEEAANEKKPEKGEPEVEEKIRE